MVIGKHAGQLVRLQAVTFGLGSVLTVAAATLSLVSANSVPAHVDSADDPRRQLSAIATVEPGTRLVGIGHAAVAVPLTWATNRTRCGTPQQDTVVIDVASVPLCATYRPPGVESIEVTPGKPLEDLDTPSTIEIDGERVLRQPTTCRTPTSCVGTVYVPSQDVTFRADSSTDAAAVDKILDQVHIIPTMVAVPGWQLLTIHARGNALQIYLDALWKAGLEGVVAPQRTILRGGGPQIPSGRIRHVSPEVGTMLTPGQTVAVSVTGQPMIDAAPR